MKVIVGQTYEQISAYAKDVVISTIKQNEAPVLGLATGSTPEGMYKALVSAYQNKEVSFKDVTTFNLDEYIGIEESDKNSYYYFMNEHLFNHVDITSEQTHLPPGNATDISEACQSYEATISKYGAIDLQVLGIGTNGHIGFNEPGTPFDTRTHVIELEASTREANARFFDSLDQVPTHAMTMGIATILDSKEIILIASGDSKKEAIKRLLEGEVTTDFPASALYAHKNITVVLDKEAASLLATDQIDHVLS